MNPSCVLGAWIRAIPAVGEKRGSDPSGEGLLLFSLPGSYVISPFFLSVGRPLAEGVQAAVPEVAAPGRPAGGEGAAAAAATTSRVDSGGKALGFRAPRPGPGGCRAPSQCHRVSCWPGESETAAQPSERDLLRPTL